MTQLDRRCLIIHHLEMRGFREEAQWHELVIACDEACEEILNRNAQLASGQPLKSIYADSPVGLIFKKP